MKKVLFLLIALFTLCATIEANATPCDKRPKRGYNYKKANRQAKVYNSTNRSKILRQNGGCGWMNR
jgi:hypothetical protein